MLSPVVTDVSTTWVEGKGKTTCLALMICLPLRLSKRQSPLWQPLVGEWGREKRGFYWSTWIPELPCVGTSIITLSLWLCQFPCLGSSSSPSKQICTVDDNVTFKISVLVILILDIRSRLTLLLLRWNSSALDLKETFSGTENVSEFSVFRSVPLLRSIYKHSDRWFLCPNR